MLSFFLFQKFVSELLSVTTVVEMMTNDATNYTREKFAICGIARFAILITATIPFLLLALMFPIFRFVLLLVVVLLLVDAVHFTA